MKTYRFFYILLISVVAAMSAKAQTFSPTPAQPSVQNSQLMNSGGAYSGTVYEPFATTAPSEQSAVGASQGPNRAPGSIRRENGFDTPTNPGTQSNESPIGEPWIMVLFAVLFAGAIALKRRKRA